MNKNIDYIDLDSCYPHLDDIGADHYCIDFDKHYVEYKNIDIKIENRLYNLNHMKMDCIYTIQGYNNSTKHTNVENVEEMYQCEEVNTEFLKKMIHLELKKNNLDNIYLYELPKLIKILENISNLFSIYENYGKEMNHTITHNEFNELETVINSNEPCVICSENMETNCKKLKCGHIFHDNCIKQWLLHYSDKCPYCKHKVK